MPRHVRVRQRQFVYRRVDTRVDDGPSQVARRLAIHIALGRGRRGRTPETARAWWGNGLGHT